MKRNKQTNKSGAKAPRNTQNGMTHIADCGLDRELTHNEAYEIIAERVYDYLNSVE